MTWTVEQDSNDTTGAPWWTVSNTDGSRQFRAFEESDAQLLAAVLNADLADYAQIAREGCYQVVGDLVLVSVSEMARLVRDARHPDDKWTAVINADQHRGSAGDGKEDAGRRADEREQRLKIALIEACSIGLACAHGGATADDPTRLVELRRQAEEP